MSLVWTRLYWFSFQAYPLLLTIVKAGGHRGLQECQKQFKNEIWNCTLDNKNVYKELPIFVKTTLPYGKLDSWFVDSTWSQSLLGSLSTQQALYHETTSFLPPPFLPSKGTRFLHCHSAGCFVMILKDYHQNMSSTICQFALCVIVVGVFSLVYLFIWSRL